MALHILPRHATQGEKIESPQTEAPDDPAATPLPKERVSYALMRANAEQAQRIADCARTTLETLLRHLDQPCAVVDRNGTVIQWNDSLAELSGLEGAQTVGQDLQTLLCLSSTHDLARELCALSPATTYNPQIPTLRVLNSPLPFLPEGATIEITLIPLCRVPGSLEAMIILFCAA